MVTHTRGARVLRAGACTTLLLVSALLAGRVQHALGAAAAATNTSPKGSSPARTAGKAMADTIVSALGGDVAKAKAVLELARTDTDSTIRGILQRPAGLAAADLMMTRDITDGLPAQATIRAINHTISRVKRSAASADTEDALEAVRAEAVDVLEAAGSGREHAHVILFFEDNKGRYTAFSFIVRETAPTKWQQKNVRYYTLRVAYLHGTFEPAPDFMIIRDSKSNLLGSKSKDRIVEINRGLTEQHINLVMGVAMPRLAAFVLAEQRLLNPSICSNGACGGSEYKTVPIGM